MMVFLRANFRSNSKVIGLQKFSVFFKNFYLKQLAFLVQYYKKREETNLVLETALFFKQNDGFL